MLDRRNSFKALGAVALGLTASTVASAPPVQRLGVGGDLQNLLDRTKVEAWLAAYGDAWETRNSDKVVRIFQPNGRYRENAFAAPMLGHAAIRDYWDKTVADQSGVDFGSTLWSVSDTVAVAHWTSKFVTVKTKQTVRLDGVFHLTFDKAATGALLCSELLEWYFVST